MSEFSENQTQAVTGQSSRLTFIKGMLCVVFLAGAFSASAQQPHISEPTSASASAETAPIFNFKPDWSHYLVAEPNLLTQQDEESISNRLTEVNKKTTHTVGVVVVGSTMNEPIEEYTARVGKEWDKSRSTLKPEIVILFAKNDGVINFSFAVDLHTIISDQEGHEIIDKLMFPEFIKGAFGQGFLLGLNRIDEILVKVQAKEDQVKKADAEAAAAAEAKKVADDAAAAAAKKLADQAAADAKRIADLERIVQVVAGVVVVCLLAIGGWFLVRRRKGNVKANRPNPKDFQLRPALVPAAAPEPAAKADDTAVQSGNWAAPAINESIQPMRATILARTGLNEESIEKAKRTAIGVSTSMKAKASAAAQKLGEEFRNINEARQQTIKDRNGFESKSKVKNAKVFSQMFWARLTGNQRRILIVSILASFAAIVGATSNFHHAASVDAQSTDAEQACRSRVTQRFANSGMDPMPMMQALAECEGQRGQSAETEQALLENRMNAIIIRVRDAGGVCVGVAHFLEIEKDRGNASEFQELLGKARQQRCI